MSISTFQMITAYIRTSDFKDNTVALLSVIAGCMIFGALTLKHPEHRAFHRARVSYIGVRLGSKSPGVRFMSKLENGQEIMTTSPRYNPNLRPGAVVCLQELKEKFWGATYYVLALPSKCAP